MPSSLTKQILSEHLAEGELTPGSPIALRVDQALLQDATGTMALMQFEELGRPRIELERAVQYVDHNVVTGTTKSSIDSGRFLRGN
jgi:aconitate hydratase